MDHLQLKKAIIKSQHCQRNWDLNSKIPEDDLDLLIYAATQCPSKQNIAFYKAHFIQDRNLIDQIHEATRHPSRHPKYESETNSQILANLVIVFESNDYTKNLSQDIYRNEETSAILTNSANEQTFQTLMRDKNMAVGIAAGYVNLTASILGYATGCCACFDGNSIKKSLNISGEILLLMGVGFKNPLRNRRIHHQFSDIIFSTKVKQPIDVTIK